MQIKYDRWRFVWEWVISLTFTAESSCLLAALSTFSKSLIIWAKTSACASWKLSFGARSEGKYGLCEWSIFLYCPLQWSIGQVLLLWKYSVSRSKSAKERLIPHYYSSRKAEVPLAGLSIHYPIDFWFNYSISYPINFWPKYSASR